MNDQVLGIAITALLGIAGILSTHLLSRAQRRGEQARLKTERRDRYRFAQYELAVQLYADLVAELRLLLIAIRLRVQVTGRVRNQWGIGLAEEMRTNAANAVNPGEAKKFLEFADALDADPSIAILMAREREDGLPPAVDTMTVVRRVTELASRIGIVGGNEGVLAARNAERAATTTLLRLDAEEQLDFRDGISTEELERAILAVEEVAIYELKLLPYGEKSSLEELRKLAAEDPS